jgi:hypothetical protein
VLEHPFLVLEHRKTLELASPAGFLTLERPILVLERRRIFQKLEDILTAVDGGDISWSKIAACQHIVGAEITPQRTPKQLELRIFSLIFP